MVAILFTLAIFVGVCNGTPGSSRIVGGSPTTVQQYPAIVQVNGFDTSIGYWRQHCGGNILTNNVVVTAAHCIGFVIVPCMYSIRAGATIRNVGGVIGYITTVIVHPNYNDPSVAADGDIALLRLRDNLIFGDTINSISIPPQDYVVPANSPGIYAGWGFNDEQTDNLLHVDVNILSHDECERRYGRPINQDLVCAGYDGKDACANDSGGPLYYGGVLVGLVAWGPFPCGHPVEPGAAIRTAAYTDWIVANA